MQRILDGWLRRREGGYVGPLPERNSNERRKRNRKQRRNVEYQLRWREKNRRKYNRRQRKIMRRRRAEVGNEPEMRISA